MTGAGQSHTPAIGIVSTHNRTCVTITGDLCNRFSRCTVVDENFGVGANTSEVVPGRRKPHVLYKLCVRPDALKKQFVRIWPCKIFRYAGLTEAYLNGTPGSLNIRPKSRVGGVCPYRGERQL
jgi:hypothetical protein